MNILIVDDHPANRKLLRVTLAAEGIETLEAADGVEALAVLEREKVDAIISDILMPRMDGYRLCKEVRASSRFYDIPFIFYTATYTSPGDEKFSLEVGADKFLKKPASAAVIMEALRLAKSIHHSQPAPTASPQELSLMKEYNERLVAKLEQKNEELLLQTTALESAANCVTITDGQGYILWVNRAFTTQTGYTLEEVIGKTPRLLKSGNHDQPFYRSLWETILSGQSWRGELTNRRKGGSLFLGEQTITPVHSEAGTISHFIGIMNDVTERKRAEEELRATQNQLRHLLEHSPAVLYSLKVDGERVIPRVISENITRLLGFTVDESCNFEWWESHLHPDDRERAVAGISETIKLGVLNTEYRMQRKDGQYVWVEDSRRLVLDTEGRPTDIVGVWTNITERKQVQSQMLRAQRLESIGTLAGGIAHDLNNALAPILMVTSLLRMRYPDAAEMIDTMEASAGHAADMVRQLLTFAKGVEGERVLLKSQHLLNEMYKIVKGSFPKNIQVKTNYPNNLQLILGDATQLHQVLLNLCVNARDAMANGGTLTLEAENAEIDTTYASVVPEARPGRYVLWRVGDTGTGIPLEIQERIFEPFFSTKAPDKGTGLGLSTVMGIVKSHNGFIRVYSKPGQGSTFMIYLPASSSSAGDISLHIESKTTFRGNRETILVVDDEAAVRQIARSVLTALNFEVVTAADGTEALVKVAEKRAELRTVITDMHMPHMDGVTFVRVLRHMVPEAHVIVTSGRWDEKEEDEFKKLGVACLLGKPFTQEKLIEALKLAFKK